MRSFPRTVRFCFIFAVFFVVTGALALPVAADTPLKVLELNFNSELSPVDGGYFVRDHRFERIVQWIEQNNPDVVFLAEAWSYRHDPTVAIAIARATGYDLAYRLELGFPRFFYEADAVLTKKSLGMRDEKDLKLPHSAFEFGNGKTWVIPFGAVSYAVGVSLTLEDGSPAYVYATHLVGSSADDRADQANAILADVRNRAAKDGVPWDQAQVVIGGDFNSAPTDPASLAMKADGYVDSFDAAHPGDPSCSDCEQTSDTWFNPFTIGGGQFPSQTGDNSTLRDDYVWIKSPSMTTLASTLMFTQPENGVWMSDHYGVMSEFGEAGSEAVSNPVHDGPELTGTDLVQIPTNFFDCGWIPDDEGCTSTLSPVTVSGPRGFSIENDSDFYFDVYVEGPGVIMTTNEVGLSPGEHVSFTFDTPGDFTYTIRNDVQSPNRYRAELSGTFTVTPAAVPMGD